MDAVRPANLTIQEGEFFSLLGPSGCGKTTLLRLLGGFENPTSGEILLEGKRIDQLAPHKRQFNMVFQKYALFPHLNVQQNVAFGLEVKNVHPDEIQTRVEEALALVQMQEYRERMVTTLSGGQQQRIALARALVNRPKVLLLDEPLSALDLKLRQQMQVELLALQRRLKITFIFVTHDQDEALTLSDRIAVMNKGVIEQVATPQEIYEFPGTEFVASFIGSMNAFPGEVLSVASDRIELAAVGTRKPYTVKPSTDPFRALPQLPIGSLARLMVRPEKIRVLKSQPGPDKNGVECTIKEILYKGPVTQFVVESKMFPGQVFSAAQLSTQMVVRKNFTPGERAFLSWAPEDCLIMPFPPAGATASSGGGATAADGAKPGATRTEVVTFA